MQRTGWLLGLALLLAAAPGCKKTVPQIDLSQVDPAFLQRCTESAGALVVRDDRLHDYWGGGYDPAEWLLFGEERGSDVTRAPTDRMVVRKRLLKILSEKGAREASVFSVVHYRENLPPVEAHVWMPDGTPRKVRVDLVKTAPLADWPCESSFPRQTDFRIATLMAGDTVEILQPVTGPEKLFWSFGSDRFCTLSSRATFGHPSDEFRPDLNAVVIDATGGVTRTSPAESYPMVFELKKPLPPISQERLPFVLLAPRCPGWKNLRGRIFLTALWMARAGEVVGRDKVNPFLTTPVKNNEYLRRLQATGDWLHQRVQVEENSGPYWMRWIPPEPAHQTAIKRRGSPGSVAALTFRILEDAGLKARFALVHTHPRNPFQAELPTSVQFDTLAVVADDESGKTHWLVPGLPFDPERQPPPSLHGRKALVMQRWWADREQGAGRCQPELDLVFSCQIATPEPVEVELITVGE